MPGRGPAALSLAAHGAAMLLLMLAFGQARPMGAPARRAMPAIELGVALPKPAPAQAAPPLAPPRLPRHAAHSAAPPQEPPLAQAGDAPAAAVEQTQPVVASTVPAAPDEAAAEAAPVATGPAQAPPLLYLAEVSRMIRLRLDYPEQARLDRARGTALVHILLARDGTVLSVELVHGAGHPALDAEAREVVLRIHKFPELPDYYARGEQRFAIDQPIGFRGG